MIRSRRGSGEVQALPPREAGRQMAPAHGAQDEQGKSEMIGNDIRTMITPNDIPRTRRRQDLRVMTSLQAGKFTPIAMVPLLREDSAIIDLSAAFQMQETIEVLMNAVVCDVHAYLVPYSAAERFVSYDDLNRAYAGVERTPGEGVIKYIETGVAGVIGDGPTDNQIFHRLGIHAKPTDVVNMFPIEAVNMVWNHIAKNLSPNITQRARLDKTIPPAFWPTNMFSFIKPDFDEATMDGAVGITTIDGLLPVKRDPKKANLKFKINTDATERDIRMKSADGNLNGTPIPSSTALVTDITNMVAELTDGSLTFSLANIELARQSQQWAALRKKYEKLPEEFLIDLLMSGIPVPELAWQQPIPLARETVNFGMAKRYASDGASLTESVVNGAAGIQMRINVPRCNPGGVVMVFAQIAPEQMFERMRNPFVHRTTVAELPDAMRDFLDPQKVTEVPKKFVDIDHDHGDDLFGYAPNNYDWMVFGPCIGGRFMRQFVDEGFSEDRLYFWAVEQQNPELTEDFYLVNDIHLKPFWTSLIDPFDVMVKGAANITGLTQFGPLLIEKVEDSYQKVLDKVDQTRIEKV